MQTRTWKLGFSFFYLIYHKICKNLDNLCGSMFFKLTSKKSRMCFFLYLWCNTLNVKRTYINHCLTKQTSLKNCQVHNCSAMQFPRVNLSHLILKRESLLSHWPTAVSFAIAVTFFLQHDLLTDEAIWLIAYIL